jgi:WD40 repeat protein
MIIHKIMRGLIGATLVALALTGCGNPATSPVSPALKPDTSLIFSTLSTIASGQGVPDAALYNPDEHGTHTVVLLTTSGTAYNDWNEEFLPYGWFPSSVSDTELAVLIGAEREIRLESANYINGAYVTAYRYEVDMEIREARTGKTLATSTFKGSDPRPFPGTLPSTQTRLEGSHFVYAAVEEWYCQNVNQMGCWIPLPTIQDNNGTKIMSFSIDGKILASGSDYGILNLWQVSDGMLLRTLDLETTGTVSCIAFSPDGKTLAFGSDSGILKLWRVSDGTLLITLDLGWEAGILYSLTFSPDGQTLVSWTSDNIVRLWNVSNGTLLFEFAGIRMAFSPDGQILAIGSDEGTVQLWRVADGVLVRSLEMVDPYPNIAFSPDGQILASGSRDGIMRMWRVADGTLLNTLEGPAPMTDVTFSADGQTLAAGTTGGTEAVRLWRVSDGSLVRSLEGGGHLFSPGGQILVSFPSTPQLRRVSDGILLGNILPQEGAVTLIISPDGHTLASGLMWGTINIWRMR